MIMIVSLFLMNSMLNAEEAPLWKNVKGWDVRVDPTLGNGCFTYQYYEGETFLRLGIDKLSGGFYIMIGNPDWKSVEAGKQYSLKIQFGKRSPWNGTAVGVDLGDITVLSLRINENESMGSFFNEFMEELYIDFWFNEKSIAKLSLKGSYKAGLELLKCQKTLNEINDKKSPFRNPKDPFNENKPANPDPFDI